MGFEQATIPIEKEREFAQLRASVERLFAPPADEKFLASVKAKGFGVREFDRILNAGLIDKADPQVGSARKLYEALSLTDQGQLREFYLERLEKVNPELRHKFFSIYRSI